MAKNNSIGREEKSIRIRNLMSGLFFNFVKDLNSTGRFLALPSFVFAHLFLQAPKRTERREQKSHDFFVFVVRFFFPPLNE